MAAAKRIRLGCLFIILLISFSSKAGDHPGRTKVVILGTGNPNPDPSHSGCSVAVIVDDSPYIVDFGPGVVRQFAALTPRWGGSLKGLKVKNLKQAFLSHLHSDHTIGYADLILTPWVMGRDEPLEVYGPEGLEEMTINILEAYKEDVRYRVYGSEPGNNTGWRVNVHEIVEGIVYKDQLIQVEAFNVKHGTWPNAYGFRFTTPDRVIVISGDTGPCDNVMKHAKKADVLIHEVYYQKGFETKSDTWKQYHKTHHTSTLELGKIAQEAKPGLVILYHTLYWGGSDEDLLREIRSVYRGEVVVGKDLKVY